MFVINKPESLTEEYGLLKLSFSSGDSYYLSPPNGASGNKAKFNALYYFPTNNLIIGGSTSNLAGTTFCPMITRISSSTLETSYTYEYDTTLCESLGASYTIDFFSADNIDNLYGVARARNFAGEIITTNDVILIFGIRANGENHYCSKVSV
jgi:hypothetical protein